MKWLSLVLILLIASCSMAWKTRQLDTADYRANAESALESGDCRFISVSGFSEISPGVDYKIAQKYGTVLIDNTGDNITSEEQGKFKSAAFRYAEKYNALVLEFLKKNPDCKSFVIASVAKQSSDITPLWIAASWRCHSSQ